MGVIFCCSACKSRGLTYCECPQTDDFEAWLRTECFKAPTKEAYDLAKAAWKAARK